MCCSCVGESFAHKRKLCVRIKLICFERALTRFNKIAIQDKTPCCRVDKEAIGLSRVSDLVYRFLNECDDVNVTEDLLGMRFPPLYSTVVRIQKPI